MTSGYLESTRKTIVEGLRIDYHSPAEGTFHDWVAQFTDGERRDVWIVWITFRTGITGQTIIPFVWYSQQDAQLFSDRHPVGEVVEDGLLNSNSSLKELLRIQLDQAATQGFASPADPDAFLIYDVLRGAGITDQRGEEPSQAVQEFLGSARIEELKKIHDGVWGKCAEFEYCSLNLPHSSPAYIASACRFHYYVTQDDFSAGYFFRELEIVVMGVEADAYKARETRKNAGKRGSESSSKARKNRIFSLMEALENAAESNPDVIKMLGEKGLLSIAKRQAVSKAPKLWSQGQNQVKEYLGEIKRGEAGEPLKERYLRLFNPGTA